mgnify:CR=1 FL=1
MNDTTKQTNMQDARTPEDALKIARARISDLMDEYVQKADAAAWDGDASLADFYGAKEPGLEQAWVLMGDLLYELNEQSR